MKKIFILLFTAVVLSCCQKNKSEMETNKKEQDACTDKLCRTKNQNKQITCKLTSPELQKRKETVLASLKSQVIEKKELNDGFAFKFNGSDKMLDELTEFVKTERECCDFFTFNLSVSGDQSETWLEIKGGKQARDFIESEMGM